MRFKEFIENITYGAPQHLGDGGKNAANSYRTGRVPRKGILGALGFKKDSKRRELIKRKMANKHVEQ